MRIVLASALFLCLAQPAAAAEQKAIDAAVKKGAHFLAEQYKDLKAAGGADGIGPPAMAGLALLECGRAADDPSVKAIAAAVRDTAYTEVRTYQLSLCLLFLDRLGRKADEPLIQLLAVRLLAGQNGNGGWTYDCTDSIPKAEEQRLRAKLDTSQLVADGRGATAPKDEKVDPLKPPVGGRLHAEVERHRQGLLANARNRVAMPDDNSNTQFAILAVWVARKHGVNVEAALDLLEKRFLASQMPSGGWPYSGLLRASEGSPSMTCAGLLGLATGLGRREERRMQAVVPKKPEPKPEPKSDDDPFFKPAPKPEPKKQPEPKKPAGDARDKAVDLALGNLGAVLRGGGVARGQNPVRGGRLNDRDLYFLWSLERVGVVYGLQKIGNVDWYAVGSDILIPHQHADGSWSGGHSDEVDTSFALLFLARSNLVRDLSAKVQRDPSNAELRGGPGVGVDLPAPEPRPMPTAKPDPVAVIPMPTPSPALPVPMKAPLLPASDEAAKLAEALLKVPAAAWPKALEQVRDGKGTDFTHALALVIGQVDGERKKAVRDALAERLTRMSAETLRGLLKGEDVELRRAAALACAMKDDKTHVPDLIERIAVDDDFVVKAARAGLKSLSGGKDFGPEPGYSKLDRAVAVEEWTAWWARQKK